MATATTDASMARDLTLVRRLAAPRALVFEAWSDPAHLAAWWGPHGYATRVTALELKPGGAFDLVMTGPDGVGHPMMSRFEDVAPPERLSFSFVAEAPAGVAALKGRVEVRFVEADGETELTLKASVVGLAPHAAQMIAGMEPGWSQSLDRLAAQVQASTKPADPGASSTSEDKAENALTICRTFDAPRELVFKLLSHAEHLARWWGPAGWDWVQSELDFRPGGQFHYCMRMAGGPEMWGKFLYREIEAPHRIVFINGFSNAAGELTHHPMAPTWPLEVLNVLTLEEQDGRTTLTLRGRPYNASALEQQTFDAGHDSMRKGFGGTFDQLAAYLAQLQG